MRHKVKLATALPFVSVKPPPLTMTIICPLPSSVISALIIRLETGGLNSLPSWIEGQAIDYTLARARFRSVLIIKRKDSRQRGVGWSVWLGIRGRTRTKEMTTRRASPTVTRKQQRETDEKQAQE